MSSQTSKWRSKWRQNGSPRSPRRHLGHPLGTLGTMLGASGSSWAAPWSSWGALWELWGCLWEVSGMILGAFWDDVLIIFASTTRSTLFDLICSLCYVLSSFWPVFLFFSTLPKCFPLEPARAAAISAVLSVSLFCRSFSISFLACSVYFR